MRQAFEAAWAAACNVEASTIVVPSGSIFLLHPISFSGPNCAENIVFQVRFTKTLVSATILFKYKKKKIACYPQAAYNLGVETIE